jgi:hypothetical protein
MTSLNSRPISELERRRHALRVRMAETGKPKKGLDHVGEALAGRDLHPSTRVAVARVPPVVPHVRLDDSRLALAQDARLPVTLHGQFPLEHGEALDKGGVEMLPDDARPDERSQLGGRAALGIRVRKLEDLGSLTGDGVLQTSPTSIGLRSGAPCGSGCDMRTIIITPIRSLRSPRARYSRSCATTLADV